jgi:AAHS family 4-hydroxybenzoate transporter-like MFS transporter
MWSLPESLQGLSQRGQRAKVIGATLARMNPRLIFPEPVSFICDKKEKGFPVALLFREGRSWVTIPLWIMFFMSLLELFFLNSWLPTILHKAGISQHQAIVLASLLHFGGIAGGLVLGPLSDRFSPYLVLGVAYVFSGVCIAAIGGSGNVAILAMAATFFAGFFTFGAQNTANATAALHYPTAMRSSGIGWALGIGRIGQIAGPLIGGLLLSLQWGTQGIFYVIAVPSLVAAAAAFFLRNSSPRLKTAAENVAT